MANEMVQGLLQNLLQPTQGPSPADIMAAISSRNPMASVAAMQAPQLSQMFGQQFRGLMGAVRGQPAPLTGNEAYAAAIQQLSQQPGFMANSESLLGLAKAASAVGRMPEAMQFSMLASQAQQQEAESNKNIASQSLVRNTNISAIDSAIASVDAAKYPGLINALEGLKNQYATEPAPSDPSKVQTTLSSMFERYKVEAPETQGLTPPQTADLYKNFTVESVQAFIKNPNAVLVPLSKPEGDAGLTLNQRAALQEKFTAESVNAFANNPSVPLVPRPDKPSTIPPSTLAIMYEQFTSDSVQAFLKDPNTVLVPRPERAKEITPAEQVKMLDDAIKTVPTYSNTAANIAQLTQVKDLLPLLNTNNPEAYSVISAVVPQLVGSNARAQAEIETFRNNKGIRESIGDYLKRLAGSTPTAETQSNVKEIINILDANFTAQRQREISQVVSNYKGVIPDERLNNWSANLMSSMTDDDISNIVNRNLSP
jgi:hypothetical protein